MKRAFLILLIFSATFRGQKSHSDSTTAPTPKKQIIPSRFQCPDPDAKQSCQSYEELRKASDKGVKPLASDNQYVCFRKNTDEFFVVGFDKPNFSKEWNASIKKVVIDPRATSPGAGYADTYSNGIADSSVMPSLFFSGKWTAFTEGGNFTADYINIAQIDPKADPVSFVEINENQVNIQYVYKNGMNESIQYNLIIQRSTGRFSEKFLDVAKQMSSLDCTGRCIFEKSKM